MLEEIRDFLLQSLPAGGRLVWPRAWKVGHASGRLSRGQFFADLGHRPQDRLGQFLDDVEFADLVRNVAEHRTQRLGYRGEASVVTPSKSSRADERF